MSANPDSDVLEALLGFKNKVTLAKNNLQVVPIRVLQPIRDISIASTVTGIKSSKKNKVRETVNKDLKNTDRNKATNISSHICPTYITSTPIKSNIHENSSKRKFIERRDPSSPEVIASASIVRREEVEAALKSKPQRGKKRENLSALERLELTRTRNREHAKSTRLRKKARYQELLDGEEQLRQFLIQDQLRSKRQKCVLQFMKIRSEAIKRRFSPCEGSCGTILPSMENLEDIIESQSSFKFIQIKAAANVGSETKRIHSIGTSALCKNDNEIFTKIINVFGKSVLPFLQLGIVGDEKGIGLTDDGAFAQYHLFIKHPNSQDRNVISEGIVRAHFAENSHRMTAMELWSTCITKSNSNHTINNVPFVSSECLSSQGSGTLENVPSVASQSNRSARHPFEV